MAIKGIDRILALEENKGIVTERDVDESENIFLDHFPEYSIYPGAMMLEGMVQSAAWFVHKKEGFVNSQVFMSSLKQVKYSKIVRPNTVLNYEVEMTSENEGCYEFKARALECDKSVAVARFTMKSGSVGNDSPDHSRMENILNDKNKRLYNDLLIGRHVDVS
jgi:3-hydroxyacyl-[acyl-carrier-protein] dehydratase